VDNIRYGAHTDSDCFPLESPEAKLALGNDASVLFCVVTLFLFPGLISVNQIESSIFYPIF
jgi:hypothetical protein